MKSVDETERTATTLAQRVDVSLGCSEMGSVMKTATTFNAIMTAKIANHVQLVAYKTGSGMANAIRNATTKSVNETMETV